MHPAGSNSGAFMSSAPIHAQFANQTPEQQQVFLTIVQEARRAKELEFLIAEERRKEREAQLALLQYGGQRQQYDGQHSQFDHGVTPSPVVPTASFGQSPSKLGLQLHHSSLPYPPSIDQQAYQHMSPMSADIYSNQTLPGLQASPHGTTSSINTPSSSHSQTLSGPPPAVSLATHSPYRYEEPQPGPGYMMGGVGHYPMLPSASTSGRNVLLPEYQTSMTWDPSATNSALPPTRSTTSSLANALDGSQSKSMSGGVPHNLAGAPQTQSHLQFGSAYSNHRTSTADSFSHAALMPSPHYDPHPELPVTRLDFCFYVFSHIVLILVIVKTYSICLLCPTYQ